MNHLARGPGNAGDRRQRECLHAPTPQAGEDYKSSEAQE